MVSDLVSSSIAMVLFNLVRSRLIAGAYSLSAYYHSPMVRLGQIAFPLIMIGVFYLSGFYNSPVKRSRMQDLLLTAGACIAGTLLIVFSVLIDDLSRDRTRDYQLFAILFMLLFGCVWLPRLAIASVVSHHLRKGHIYTPTAIVGYGSRPEHFSRQLSRLRPWMGYKPIALLSIDGEAPAGSRRIGELSVEACPDIAGRCAALGVKSVILLPHPSGEWTANLTLLRQLMPLCIPVMMPWDGLGAAPIRYARHLDVSTDPLVTLNGANISPSTQNLKRCADILLSGVALAISIVPLLLLGLGVRITTGDSPLYRQKRLGLGGKPFTIYKLRTMRADAEPDGQPRLSSATDRRITPIGAFMRKYRLDEMPQFWNVLRGDMSLVGPRPEREFFARQIIERDPSYLQLYQVRPGITSWGMIKYGYATTVDQMLERMRYDMLYVDNISMLLDLKILFYTFHTVITGKGL